MFWLLRIATSACLTVGANAVLAAELGQRYTSYLDLHRETSYGSLFFNEGSIRQQDNKERKRFVTIRGSGDLNLPLQQGYCFVFNHYGRGQRTDASFQYRAQITKLFGDGRKTRQVISSSFTPTDDPVSSALPDLCVFGLNNVSQVAIDFSSNDGDSFDWNIAFAIR